MFIGRDYNRTEHDDFFLNIQPKLFFLVEAIEIKIDDVLVGWELKLK